MQELYYKDGSIALVFAVIWFFVLRFALFIYRSHALCVDFFPLLSLS